MKISVWEEFRDNRETMLRHLAEPVLDGLGRNDSPHHPVFHGNYDWHSCVHACYALCVLFRLTGDEKYIAPVHTLFNPAKLAEEEHLLDEIRVTPDIRAGRQYAWFYGYSWLLQLAGEYERAGGDARLRPLTAKAAEKLEDHIFGLTESDVASYAADPEYRNLSWKLLSLHRWAVQMADTALQENLAAFAEHNLAGLAVADKEQGFFSPSLMRAEALITLCPTRFEGALYPAPLHILKGPETGQHPSQGHLAGLNFSRAWGLWAVYRHTGDSAARDSYAAHVSTQFNLKTRWHSAPDGVFDKKMYDYFGHWVPQYGIRAIAASIESPAPSCG